MSEEESLQGMTGPGDEPEADPSGEVVEPDEENLISDAMVKKATYHIHKLAEQRKQDYKEIQKRCKQEFDYTNLAKVSMDKGHKIIDDLVKRTGGEEESQQGARVTDDGSKAEKIKEKPAEKKEAETKTEDDMVTATMRKAIRAAVDITLKEVVEKDVPVQGLGGFVLEIGKVIFEAKLSEETDEK